MPGKVRHAAGPEKPLGAGADAAPLDLDDHILVARRGSARAVLSRRCFRSPQHDGEGVHSIARPEASPAVSAVPECQVTLTSNSCQAKLTHLTDTQAAGPTMQRGSAAAVRVGAAATRLKPAVRSSARSSSGVRGRPRAHGEQVEAEIGLADRLGARRAGHGLGQQQHAVRRQGAARAARRSASARRRRGRGRRGPGRRCPRPAAAGRRGSRRRTPSAARQPRPRRAAPGPLGHRPADRTASGADRARGPRRRAEERPLAAAEVEQAAMPVAADRHPGRRPRPAAARPPSARCRRRPARPERGRPRRPRHRPSSGRARSAPRRAAGPPDRAGRRRAGVVLDHGGDAGIAEHRRTQLRPARSGSGRAVLHEVQERAAASSAAGRFRPAVASRAGQFGVAGPGQDLEQPQPDAGEQHLGVDEAGAQIEQRPRPPPRRSAGSAGSEQPSAGSAGWPAGGRRA